MSDDPPPIPDRFRAGIEVSSAFGERVVLRVLGRADAGAFAAHVEADLERLREHLPWPEATSSQAGARDWLEGYEAQRDGRVVVLGAWAGSRLLGGALLFHHDRDAAIVELGCWVIAAAEGRGVASAGCRTLIAFARNELAAERLEWHTTTANVASRRLAERG